MPFFELSSSRRRGEQKGSQDVEMTCRWLPSDYIKVIALFLELNEVLNLRKVARFLAESLSLKEPLMIKLILTSKPSTLTNWAGIDLRCMPKYSEYEKLVEKRQQLLQGTSPNAPEIDDIKEKIVTLIVDYLTYLASKPYYSLLNASEKLAQPSEASQECVMALRVIADKVNNFSLLGQLMAVQLKLIGQGISESSQVLTAVRNKKHAKIALRYLHKGRDEQNKNNPNDNAEASSSMALSSTGVI